MNGAARVAPRAGIKVGVTVPQFDRDAAGVLAASRRAERLGLDGVFCFDHLWPLGRPSRPALSPWPLLGAVAASTSTITVGSLVARIGLVDDDRLVAVLGSLSSISGGRFIAGIGTGDVASRAENLAFGVPFEPAARRRARLAAVAISVQAEGIPVWIGGGAAGTIAVARRVGAAVNLWGAAPDRLAGLAGTGTETTWGGPVGATEVEVAARLRELAAAGASWAVCAWPCSLEMVAAAAAAVRNP